MKINTLMSGAILVGLLGSLSVAAQQKPSIAGVRNYTRVDATVACAGATSLESIPEIKREGFVSIINFRLANEPEANVEAQMSAARTAGLKYFHMPFNAAMPDPAVVETFLKTVVDKANQPVFIHCGSANRVGAMWLIKRVLGDRWTVEKATAEAEAIGLTNPALKTFALDYVKTHPK
jgi:uncharacterized protein (TIGR01244 family)